MTIQDARTGSVPVIPDGAPFSMEQRAWLNGFFAGLLSLDAKAGISPLTGELPDAAAKALAGDGDDGEAPWHDAAMPIDERMQPTLPGVEEATTPSATSLDLPPEDRAPSAALEIKPTPPKAVEPPQARQSEMVLCHVCGDIMQRAGSCYACPSCGSTSGCS